MSTHTPKGQDAAQRRPSPQLWGINDVTHYLQISRVTLYRMITAGTIRAYKAGGQWRFEPQDVEQWAKAKPNVVTDVGSQTTDNDHRRTRPTADDTDAALDAIVTRARRARNGV